MLDIGAADALGDYETLSPDAQDMRDRLALATRYLTNWYKVTSSSDNKGIWWSKIDLVRRKVEDVYKRMTDSANTYFPGKNEVAAYKDAANAFSSLYGEINLSSEYLNSDRGLLDTAASFVDTTVHAPGLLFPQIGNELGKILGGTLGNFFRQVWPVVAVAGAVGLIYVFRAPLSRLASKVGA